MNWFRLKTCIKCQGDLAADNNDWICLQCGTYYYTGLYQLDPRIDDGPDNGPQIANLSVSEQPPEQPKQKLLGSLRTHRVTATQSSQVATVAIYDAVAAL